MEHPENVSAADNRYVMNIIDDFSSYCWSVPLSMKSEAFSALQAWEIAHEAETGLRIGILRSDNGELKHNDLKDWFTSWGTQHQFTVPYTSAQNGRVERVHRTLMGKARAMRSYANVPVNRWDEFVLTACYLMNRTPVKSQQGSTPFECWYGKPPDLSHLREIGCRTFVLVQNQHNPKVFDHSVECVLIGYSLDSKVYRCFHCASGKVFTSYHVSFIKLHQVSPASAPTSSHLGDTSPASTPSPANDHVSAVPTSPRSTNDPPPLHRSSRISRPTEKRAAATSEQFIPAVQRAILAAMTMSAWEPPSSAVPLLATHAIADDEFILTSPALGHEEEDSWFAGTATIDALNTPTNPATYQEAMESPYAADWTCALQEEFDSLKELGVYRLVPRSSVPVGCRIMCGRPIFKVKRDENGELTWFKARYVCRGYTAVYGQDYMKTMSPTACMESFCVLAHLGAALDWEIEQLDIKTAFLNGILAPDEVCYMEQPEGFVEPGQEDCVWELQHGLYGMKQGGRVWNKTLHAKLIAWRFTRLKCEYCVYYRRDTAGIVVLAIHVDDFFMFGDSKPALGTFKEQLQTHWKISDGGPAHFHIGVAIERDRSNRMIGLSQMALIDHIVSQFRLADALPVATPMEPGCHLSKAMSLKTEEERSAMSWTPYRELIGSLMYLAVGTRPDIVFAVNQLCRFLDLYGKGHWEAAKRVVRYLKGTRQFRLVLGGEHTV